MSTHRWWKLGRRDHAHDVPIAPVVAAPPAQPTRRPEPERGVPEAVLVRLSTDGRQSIVGESFYQPALRSLVGGRTVGHGWEGSPEVTAILVPEPDNPHDRHAVRVTAERRTVGYLPREVAATYQAPLLRLLEAGRIGWCPAHVTGGGQDFYGAYLHIGPPERVVPVNDLAGLTMLEPHRHITVTGEEPYQAELSGLLGGAAVATAYAALSRCAIPRGKYAGQDGVEVRIDGSPVGMLTRLMAARYEPVLGPMWRAGATPGCEAVVAMSHRGLVEVELGLPDVRGAVTPGAT